MAHERTEPPWTKPSVIPDGLDWSSLLAQDGAELEVRYRHVLEDLGRERGMLGIIFRKAQNKIQDPAKLRRLIVDLIAREQWTSLDADIKGGAGQYFTPCPLIQAIVDVMRPKPGETNCDPAYGTGGFLLAAHAHITDKFRNMDPDQKKFLKLSTLHGVEIVDGVTRLWIYDLRTNKNFTLKTNPLKPADLEEFVACYRPANRHDRQPTWSEENPDGRLRAYDYADLLQRAKLSLDIFWLRDESLEDSANLPDPDIIAAEIAEDLRAALEEFETILEDLDAPVED